MATLEAIRLKILEYVRAVTNRAQQISRAKGRDENGDDEVISNGYESMDHLSDSYGNITYLSRHLVKKIQIRV